MAQPFDASAGKISDIIEDAKRSVLESLEFQFAWVLDRCGSPIEKLFAAELVHPDTGSDFDSRIEWLSPASGQIIHCEAPPMVGIYVWQQITIGAYRVDFILDCYPARGPKLVVECDGHDFHEKTKDQAQRDKARDRFLVSRGFRILRFTGSEIFRDPSACAREALEILMGIDL